MEEIKSAQEMLRYLELLGVSRRDIAKSIGVSITTVSRMAAGSKPPRLDAYVELLSLYTKAKSRLAAAEEKASRPAPYEVER